MFNEGLNILKKYINFRFKSKPKGGHGIHSPFIYDLYTQSIDVKKKDVIFDKIESLRKDLIKDKRVLSKVDFGAGTKRKNNPEENIGSIVKKASIPPYMGQLLYRIINYLKPETIIELGTSVGISTMYVASGFKNSKVFSIEGDSNLSKIASENINKLGLTNVSIVNGEFDTSLSELLNKINKIGLVFIDGNHSEEATLKYFKLISLKADGDTFIIFDDIRWSEGMERVWNNICKDECVSISIDLFNCGLIFFRKGVVKQHFNLRYGPF